MRKCTFTPFFTPIYIWNQLQNKKHTPFFPGSHTTTRQLAYLCHAIFQTYPNRHIASHTASMNRLQYRNLAKSTSIRTRYKSLTSIEQVKLRVLKKCAMMLMAKFKREKDIYVWLIDLDMDDKSIFKKYKKESDKTQILTPYNYGTIKDNEKVLMLDVIRLIENKQTIEEVKNALDTIKITFDIKNVVKYDMEKSPFLNICKENDLKPTVQGFIHINQNNKKYEYPIIGLMDDIRKLEKFLENLIKNYVIRK